MNEREYPDVGNTAVNQIDSNSFYEIYAGDTVVFKDDSEPQKDDRRRYWELDGKKETEWEALNDRLTTYVYEETGTVKVVFCVDDEKNCAAKMILVKERPEFVEKYIPPPPPPPDKKTPKEPVVRKPELKFILPNVYSTNSPNEEFTIRVSVRNISNKDDVTLIVNGQDYKKFNLSKGQLTSKIPLKEGRNLVKLTAEGAGETVSQEKEFMYSPGISATPSVGFIQPSTSTTTSNDKYDIVVATSNVAKKEQLTLTVGGKTIKDFSFSANAGELSASVPLSLGSNTIRISANTSAGKVSQETFITYTKPAAPQKTAALNRSGSVGPPTSGYPASNECTDRVRGAFSATLSPVSDVDLTSFKVYTDICGGLKVELSGPNLKSHFQTAINAGRSQISMADIDAQLSAGNKYTLTLTPIAGYGTCASSQTPSFYDVKNCADLSSATSSALKLDQKGRLLLFDLKFSY